MLSLSGTLDAMRPHLPVALVSADAFHRARAAVAHLDAEVTNGIHFECRLQEGSPRVDLVFIVRLGGGMLLAATQDLGSPGARHAQPASGPLSAFCRQWTAPGSALRNLIDHVWLEYDVEQDRSPDEAPLSASAEGGVPRQAVAVHRSRDEAPPSTPGVFCSLRRSHRTACSAPTLWRSALTALEALTGRRPSHTVQQCLFDCIARLPLESGIPHVGFMASRRLPTVRLCIAKLPTAAAEHFLAATAGVGGRDVADIARLASLSDGPGGPLYIPMLHLDIDERRGFLPRVGMERQFARSCQLIGRTGARERSLLDVLTARGLCTPDKRDALLKWPGCSVAMMPHELWWSVVERRVNHVKFVYGTDSGIETKGYLFAKHHPRHGQPRTCREDRCRDVRSIH